MNVTWSEDYNKEDESNFTAFTSKSDNAGVVQTGGSSGVTSSVSGGVQTLEDESSGNEQLTKEAIIQSYKLMHKK